MALVWHDRKSIVVRASLGPFSSRCSFNRRPGAARASTPGECWSAHGSIRIVPLIASPTTMLALNK
jgi:hypothetical protein